MIISRRFEDKRKQWRWQSLSPFPGNGSQKDDAHKTRKSCVRGSGGPGDGEK